MSYFNENVCNGTSRRRTGSSCSVGCEGQGTQRAPNSHQYRQRGDLNALQNMAQLTHQLSAMQVSTSGGRGHRSSSVTTVGRSAAARATEFSVASYNILAQYLIEEHPELYRHCNEQQLSWRFRRQNIFRQLDQHRPDIICLQEVQLDHYNSCLRPHFQANGYDGHYKRRTGERRDGCATFYNRSKFACVNCVPVEFFVPGSCVLNRDNIALLLVLTPMLHGVAGMTAPHLVVANTHLLYNPGRGDVKLAQLMFLMAAIDEVAARSFDPEPAHNPVILCGDLNLEPFSWLHKFILVGQLPYAGIYSGQMSGQKERGGRPLVAGFLEPEVGITDHSQFQELVQHRHRQWRHGGFKGCKLTFDSGIADHPFHFLPAYYLRPDFMTTWLNPHGIGGVVDYIFYSSNDNEVMSENQAAAVVSKGNLRLIGVLHLPAKGTVALAGGLPNDTEPSDHLMLIAHFALCG